MLLKLLIWSGVHVSVTSLKSESVVRRVSQNTTTNDSELINSESENPAGCIDSRDEGKLESFKKDGVYPIEDFREMLTSRTAPLFYQHKVNHELGKLLSIPWCPKPSAENDQRSFLEMQQDRSPTWLEMKHINASKYVKEALHDTDPKKPLILAVVQAYPDHSYHFLQISNFLCGLQRLGLERQLVAFTMSKDLADWLRKRYAWLRVLYHSSFDGMFKAAIQRTKLGGTGEMNRIAKLVLSDLLVNMNREVLLSDLDVMWIQNPIDYITALRTPSGALPDMVAMKGLVETLLLSDGHSPEVHENCALRT
jgi:hypothetical protein